MKKNVLALSIAAAIGGLGFAGGASAITTAYDGAPGTLGVSATGLTLGASSASVTGTSAPGGVGHILMVPYYTAQQSNATLMSITNTDVSMGKAVKVRFRGASNSDDVYDFQVFLSPGDVWTAMVSQDTVSGKAKLTTPDNSCTKPATKNGKFVKADGSEGDGTFVVDRLRSTWTDAKKAENTREGYIEILNMADIPATRLGTTIGPIGAGSVGMVTITLANELFTAVKHVKGVAPCSGDAWTNLNYDRGYGNGYKTKGTPAASWVEYSTDRSDPLFAGYTDSTTLGVLTNPTGGLMGSWTIVNLGDASAYSSAATAISAVGPAGAYSSAALVYYPQMNSDTLLAFGRTADPLFLNNNYANLYTITQSDKVNGNAWTNSVTGYRVYGNVTVGSVAPQFFDLPDLSTPYVGFGALTPAQGTAANNYAYAPARQARALSDALATAAVINEYSTLDGAVTDWVFSMPTRRYSMAVNYATPAIVFNPVLRNYFTAANSTLVGDQICVLGISTVTFDRSENYDDPVTPPVISPNPAGAPQMFCGEASVLSMGDANPTASSVLRSTVAVKGITTIGKEGWAAIVTPGVGNGLPMLGSAFLKAVAGTSAFGANWDHRYIR